jgi:glycine/D-amino acid oxidase-like deaminating enzyme
MQNEHDLSHDMYDILIVGQGIAGTCLAWQLFDRGLKVAVIDPHQVDNCSKIAAGIVNPVTGRRFVLSWKFSQLNDYARQFYRDKELRLSIQLIHEMPIIRNIDDMRFKDDVIAKIADPLYSPFLAACDFEHPDFKSANDLIEVKGAMRIDMGSLIGATSEFQDERLQVFRDTLDYQLLRINKDAFQYKDLKFEKIVFCEGASAIHNPWFTDLPFNLSKGELLTIEGKHSYDFMYKNKIFFVPIDSEKVWIGSAYDWSFKDENPTIEGKEQLLNKLQSFFKQKPRILNHMAAIRPTVRDRRPFLGRHESYSSMYIFNGLGTKGANLAPLMSEYMANYMVHDEKPISEVDISRFS